MLWLMEESLHECVEGRKKKQQHEVDIEMGTMKPLAMMGL